MNQHIVFSPKHQETAWLISLKVGHQKLRVNVCMAKMNQLYKAPLDGKINTIITLYKWYCQIRELEGYFDKIIQKLSRVIHSRTPAKIQYEKHSNMSIRMLINNPIAYTFQRTIEKYDQLLCLSETCYILGIYKKRRLYFHKLALYKRLILKTISTISQYSDKNANSTMSILDKDKEFLLMAIQSDVMPDYPLAMIESIKNQMKDTNQLENGEAP